MKRTRSGDGAFTLLELIVVMALLAIIVAVVVPAMAPFFSGRNLQNEARRFLALTRYARNEAAATGQTVEIWIDFENAAYGLESTNPYAKEDIQTREYYLADGIDLDVEADEDDPDAEPRQDESGLARIEFRPDGTISGEDFILRDSKGYGLLLEPRSVGRDYVISQLDQDTGYYR